MGGITWWTNVELLKGYKSVLLCKDFNIEEYPKYDNYCAFNVDRVVDIPKNNEIVVNISSSEQKTWKFVYGDDLEVLDDGMCKIKNPIYGVPITFLGAYNPDQFEILGLASRHSWANHKELLISLGSCWWFRCWC